MVRARSQEMYEPVSHADRRNARRLPIDHLRRNRSARTSGQRQFFGIDRLQIGCIRYWHRADTLTNSNRRIAKIAYKGARDSHFDSDMGPLGN